MNLPDVTVASLRTRILVVICLISFCEECPTGWFGRNCQFRCRCSNVTCDNEGMCGDNDMCLRGWFGPACQYVDLAYNKSIVKEITDADDDTCITDLQLTIVTVKFGAIFTWLRIFVRKPEYRHELHFFLKDHNTWKVCSKSRNASVGDSLWDMYCPNVGIVEELIITGRGVRFLCSVYISGGRNLALKQRTSQSSTYYDTDYNKTFPSSQAVDGHTLTNLDVFSTCSHTDGNSNVTAYWTLLLDPPVHVSRYVIYNRVDGREKSWPDRIKGFTLEAFKRDEVKVFSFTDSNPEAQDVYTILNEAVDVERVTIMCGHMENILTLCEVEVYGDAQCQPGIYGRECEKQCNCFNNEPCFVSSGACPSGCAIGYEGENCSTRSSSETLNKQNDISRTKLIATVSSISLVLVLVTIGVASFCRRRRSDSEAEEGDREEGDGDERRREEDDGDEGGRQEGDGDERGREVGDGDEGGRGEGDIQGEHEDNRNDDEDGE